MIFRRLNAWLNREPDNPLHLWIVLPLIIMAFVVFVLLVN